MNVRKLMYVIAVVLCGFNALAQSPTQSQQTLDEVIAKHLEAMGGLEKLKSIQTMKKVAKVSMQGRQTTTIMYFKRPNLSRQEVTIDGKQVVNAFDGTTPWIINPFSGSSRPVTVSGPTAAIIREDSSFDPPLVDYKSRGTIVDYVAKEPLGEAEVHHLRVTSASRQVRHVYLDATTFLEVKLAAEVERPGESGRTRLEQLSSDYRDVNGAKVAHHLQTIVNGVMQVETWLETVVFNLPIDDAIFRMPKG